MSSDQYRNDVFDWANWEQTLTFLCSGCDSVMNWDDRWLICQVCGIADPPHCLACNDEPAACPDCREAS